MTVTSRLPPIAKIATSATTQLFESLQYLHWLYRPHVRGSRRRRREGDFSPHCEDDDVQRVRSDPFERAYAIRWLVAFIAQLEARKEHPPTNSGPTIQLPSQSETSIDTDSLIQQAASLLANCAGVAGAGKVQRDFFFQSTLAGQIHVIVTDIPLDNQDYGSVGAQTWGGACVLAEMIAEHPDRFGLGYTGTPQSHDHRLNHTRTHPLRILELGAGTGLVGLTVAKVLQALLQSKEPNVDSVFGHQSTIILTDFYPAVLDNLQLNINANFSMVADDAGNALSISSYPLDWSSFSTTDTALEFLSTPFDVVFGADIIYEAQHAVWIHNCLKYLLSYPDSPDEVEPVFHLVIPLRRTHTFESSTIEEVFGSKDRVSDGFQRELIIFSKESIFCEAYGNELPEGSRMDDDVDNLGTYTPLVISFTSMVPTRSANIGFAGLLA